MRDDKLDFHSEPEISGVSEGESFTVTTIYTERVGEFILTVVEPEDYGKSRQVASACFSRQQMISIVASLTEALYPVVLED